MLRTPTLLSLPQLAWGSKHPIKYYSARLGHFEPLCLFELVSSPQKLWGRPL